MNILHLEFVWCSNLTRNVCMCSAFFVLSVKPSKIRETPPAVLHIGFKLYSLKNSYIKRRTIDDLKSVYFELPAKAEGLFLSIMRSRVYWRFTENVCWNLDQKWQMCAFVTAVIIRGRVWYNFEKYVIENKKMWPYPSH